MRRTRDNEKFRHKAASVIRKRSVNTMSEKAASSSAIKQMQHKPYT